MTTRVPYYTRLSLADRHELEGHVQVFLSEKRFEGADGFTITDEVRVTVAAQACILLLHRQTDYYPDFRTIVLFPSAFEVATEQPLSGNVRLSTTQTRIGEAWHRGMIILSWKDVVAGAADPDDGQNVVFHEFAHKLDGETGVFNGTPLLGNRARTLAWARVLGREYDAFVVNVNQHRSQVLDDYGATHASEFFALATEALFYRPTALKAAHPELYNQLLVFFRQDPAANLARAGQT